MVKKSLDRIELKGKKSECPGGRVLCINWDGDAHLRTFLVYPKNNRLQISSPKK